VCTFFVRWPSDISGGGCFGYLYIIVIISCYTLITIIQLYILRYKNPNAPPPYHSPPHHHPLIIVDSVTVEGRRFSGGGDVHPYRKWRRWRRWRRRHHRRRRLPDDTRRPFSVFAGVRTAITSSTPLTLLVTDEVYNIYARSFESKCACRCHDNIFFIMRENYNNELLLLLRIVNFWIKIKREY